MHLLISGREKERERERERHWSVASPMCPDQGSNPQTFGAWDDTPTNRATPARAGVCFFRRKTYLFFEKEILFIYF